MGTVIRYYFRLQLLAQQFSKADDPKQQRTAGLAFTDLVEEILGGHAVQSDISIFYYLALYSLRTSRWCSEADLLQCTKNKTPGIQTISSRLAELQNLGYVETDRAGNWRLMIT